MQRYRVLFPSTLALAAVLLLPAAAGPAVPRTRLPTAPAQSGVAPAATMQLDPTAITYKWPSQIHWVGRPGVAEQAVLVGDPMKPGLYVVLIKWFPHNTSHPHFHPNDRYITVLSGTWYVGTGRKFDPQHMVPMPAGSFVTDLAGQVHYDGARDEPVTIEIVGMGPATMTPAEIK